MCIVWQGGFCRCRRRLSGLRLKFGFVRSTATTIAFSSQVAWCGWLAFHAHSHDHFLSSRQWPGDADANQRTHAHYENETAAFPCLSATSKEQARYHSKTMCLSQITRVDLPYVGIAAAARALDGRASSTVWICGKLHRVTACCLPREFIQQKRAVVIEEVGRAVRSAFHQPHP